jgi:hypothetical protein
MKPSSVKRYLEKEFGRPLTAAEQHEIEKIKTLGMLEAKTSPKRIAQNMRKAARRARENPD